MTNYNLYHFTKRELVYEILRAVILLEITGILFLDSLLFAFFLLPAAFFLMKGRKEKRKTERLMNLRNDFKEFVVSFSASVQAGFTMEQSVGIGLADLRRMYPNQDRCMIRELEWIQQQMKLQTSCDVLFASLAERTGMEEVRSFSVVLAIGRKQGGNLVQIMKRTAEHISKKIQIQMEMEQTIAGRMMEKNIMFVMPHFIVLYLRITNTSYMEILFSTLSGRLVMLSCLIALWAANKWADKIVRIEL